jgi:hypothetical protein
MRSFLALHANTHSKGRVFAPTGTAPGSYHHVRSFFLQNASLMNHGSKNHYAQGLDCVWMQKISPTAYGEIVG